jgi:hypothetical protein
MTTSDKPHSAGEERSMTKRMLALIGRFDAHERRSGTESGDGSSPRRRRDDEPTPTSNGGDDLIVEPAQPE